MSQPKKPPTCRCGRPAPTLGKPCEECRCGAKSRGGTSVCGMWPINGGTRCRVHGGASPRARAKARERVLEAEVEKALKKLNVQPVDDPLTALLEHAGVVSAWEEHIRLEVLKLREYVYDGGVHLGERERAVVNIWERASQAKTHVLGLCARLGIADRLAAISEAQAERVIGAIDAALAAAGIDDPLKLADAHSAAGRHLAVVPAAV